MPVHVQDLCKGEIVSLLDKPCWVAQSGIFLFGRIESLCMDQDIKPRIATGLLFSAAVVLFWAVDPGFSGVREQPYAELVLVFTSIVAATSLYFIHGILEEVTGE